MNPLLNISSRIKALSAKTASGIRSHKTFTTLDILISRGWPDNKKVKWCLRNGDKVFAEGKTENLADLSEHQNNAKIIIWSPTADTLLIEADLPTRSRSKINQALPFVLEEQLLRAPEQEHFVYQIRAGLPLAVTVTAKLKIEQWLAGFRDCGLRSPFAMHPLVSGLPLERECWSLLIVDNELLVKTGEHTGFSCLLKGTDLPAQLTNSLQALKEENRPRNIIYYQLNKDVDISAWPDVLGIDFVTKSSDLWSVLHVSSPKLNLLQGEFKQKREINPALSRFAPAAIILIAWFTVSLFVNVWEWRSLKSSLSNTNKQMIQVFKSSFPGARTIVDPVLQMQRKFETLSGNSGSYLKNDFIALLTKCAPALSALQSGAIENVRYSDNNLDISLGLPDFKSLETLKERLSAIGLQVEVVAANSRTDGIEGRLKINLN